MTKIAIFGAGGRMGAALIQALKAYPSLAPVAAVEQAGHAGQGLDSATFAGAGVNGVPISADADAAAKAADVIIDFTFHTVVPSVARFAAKYKKAYVLGTTGLSDDELAAVEETAKVAPVMMAPNFSVGVNLLLELVRKAAAVLNEGYDCEITEMHHKHKKDAPSGTALALAKAVAEGRGADFATVACYGREGMTGERKPGEIAIHALRGGDVVGDHTVMFAADGERVEITHKASNRGCLANGALRAAAWIHGQAPGFKTMKDVLNL